MTDLNFSDTIVDDKGIEVHGRCGAPAGVCLCWDSEFNRDISGYRDPEFAKFIEEFAGKYKV